MKTAGASARTGRIAHPERAGAQRLDPLTKTAATRSRRTPTKEQRNELVHASRNNASRITSNSASQPAAAQWSELPAKDLEPVGRYVCDKASGNLFLPVTSAVLPGDSNLPTGVVDAFYV